MMEHDQRASETLAGAYEASFRWLALGVNNAIAACEAFQNTIQYASACQEANLNFLQQRMERDVAFGQTCCQVNTIEDFVSNWSQFSCQMSEDYIKQGHVVGDLSLQAIKDATRPLEQRAQETAGALHEVV